MAGKRKPNIYFPIAKPGAQRSYFREILSKNLPGLVAVRQDLVAVFESFHAFHSPRNVWLPELATLSAGTKHVRPVSQTLAKSSGVVGGNKNLIVFGKMTLGANAMITWPDGTSTTGPLDIDKGKFVKAPFESEQSKFREVHCIRFDFEEIGKPVLAFVFRAANGVGEILKELLSKV